MATKHRNGLLVVTVYCCLVAATTACYHQCNAEFNRRLSLAQVTGTSPSDALRLRCEAMTAHLICLENNYVNCDDNLKQIVNQTVDSMQQNYDITCKEGSPGVEAANCGTKYAVCTQQFNSTFFPAIRTYDLTVACGSITNYTACVESLMASPVCNQFANHALSTINALRSRYRSTCSGDTDATGVTMARCLNGTMECFASFNETFFPAVKLSNMTLMCGSVANYSDCITTMASDATCSQYTQQAVASIRGLEHQHQVACGQDGGKKATECLLEFKNCYQHFNDTFNPAVRTMHIDMLCESMSEYKTCSAKIPSECDVFLGQSLNNLDRMQSQYTQYCTTDNKKIFACGSLSQCNRNLLGNLTIAGADAGMLCMVLETYFPCVENAVRDCQLSGDGVSSVSFRDLGLLSSRYCRSVLAEPSIKACVNFMQCHASLDLTSMTPTQMVEGTYWCQYLESSLQCSSHLISAGQCAVTNRNDMLQNIRHLQQMATTTCTVTTPVPTTTTTQKDDGFRDTDEKDKKKNSKPKSTRKGTTDEQSGKVGGDAPSLTYSVVTLTLALLPGIFSYQHL